MKVSWFAVLTPLKISSYEHEQRARLLHFMLMAIFIGGLVNCVFSYLNGRIVAGTILALLTLICLAGFYLNHIHRQHGGPDYLYFFLCGAGFLEYSKACIPAHTGSIRQAYRLLWML